MRDIKFRAFYKNENRLVLSRDLYFDEFNPIEDYFADDEIVFMQYIGLKDKNGKEIYEGDIICKYNNGIKSYTGIVQFMRTSLQYMIVNNYGGYIFLNGQIFDEKQEYGDYEIMGNIYETPHLLT